MSTLLAESKDPRFRRARRDFSRAGSLSPELLTTLLLYMVADGNRRGYRHLLEGFWAEAKSYGLPLPTDEPVAAASFCTARPKITSSLLRHLLHQVAATAFEGPLPPHLWHGRRVFAADGVRINLQRTPDLIYAFGVPDGGHCPQILVSVLFDVVAKLPVDLEVSPSTGSEREHLQQMLPSLQAGDVLVLDRGYPSHEVLQALCQQNIDFLIRLPAAETFIPVVNLQDRGADDECFLLTPPKGAPADWIPLKLRFVRLVAPNGEVSYFVTTLPTSRFGRGLISELYHKRWDIEEHFKLLKGAYLGQGQFRSKCAAGVVQEIHALILFAAISRLCMSAAAADNKEVDFDSLSQKAAVLGLTDHLTRILLACDEKRAVLELQVLLARITSLREKRRTGRRFPRVSFKPSPRWGPAGRRGA